MTVANEPDCEDSPDGQHHWNSNPDLDYRCIWCDRKPWYETATAEGRRRKREREEAFLP